MPAPSSSRLPSRRLQVLAPTYRTFYEEPLHVVRAEGVWMYDAEGRRYLDAYNNVPVVGHGHPEVIARTTEQARLLNTHTRYLTEPPVELAERLLSTLSVPQGRMIFTCTGSDANDLAVRISKAATGGTGFIITTHAYHGTTETLSGMSPSTGLTLAPGVYAIDAPLPPCDGGEFAARAERALEQMQRDGVKPAALLVDTIFSSDGVAAHPPGLLAEAVEAIHDAGGLFIADEVQPGFGRLGEGMWGFTRHGIAPDIVTMGKPMGNGHPIAAVAARNDVLETFARGARYFNTFGGNSVACAASLAVLDVLEKERLISKARSTGAYLLKRLQQLASRDARLGPVRGSGLFIGLDVLPDPQRGLDSQQATARIVNELRRLGVLVGSCGRHSDVLKIRPPLPFGKLEADLLVERLEAAVTA